ncbi:hypothetical protein LOTGIDRAFT_162310 [Lottia gigantea]|uniref:C-type lectin domain-containing protein n=1 Tax=Lottia gigantea TaxID=225164 RepID=V4BV07_LOTGI|nr:hypothetical protein LOTGIDRAFT_162310 [Lottia gigantea]ESO92834.1 hypothetical protein LOTGIDRAFT_162310 [Lottia gigantea]
MHNVWIFIFGLFIQQRYAYGVQQIYLAKNICKIDGSHVGIEYTISILYTRSFLNCLTACFQYPLCESVIFDKSTHYCQLKSDLLILENTLSCGDLIYMQLYTEAPPSSPCCSSNGNFSSIGGTTLYPQEQTTSGPTFTLLPSVDMSIYIGPQTKNIFVASANCHHMGGELVKLDTAGKHNAVKDYIIDIGQNEEKFYIGLFARLLGWGWADGTRLDYENWSRLPMLLQTCAVMDKNENYEWLATGCLESFAYICELN